MPENIIQFQVIEAPQGHIIYALGSDGQLYFKNPTTAGGAWQPVS
jgi:hypothetical protein